VLFFLAPCYHRRVANVFSGSWQAASKRVTGIATNAATISSLETRHAESAAHQNQGKPRMTRVTEKVVGPREAAIDIESPRHGPLFATGV